jgi:branched-chain amino acid transport system permease protein
LTGERVTAPAPELVQASRAPGVAFIFKKALISALVALVLFSLMIGIRTEAGPTGQLIYWTRFGDLAAMVAIVFGGSIVIELLRQWWGPVGTVRIVPPTVQSALVIARRAIAPLLLLFTFHPPGAAHGRSSAGRQYPIAACPAGAWRPCGRESVPKYGVRSSE